MSIAIFEKSGVSHVHNSLAHPSNRYTTEMQSILSLHSGENAQDAISKWPGYEASPLHQLRGFAQRSRVGNVYYKDESERFGLKSFKALGGSYAVACQLLVEIEKQTGSQASMEDLFSGKYAELVSNITVATATDGNHGRSVAWGAEMFGCPCVIYIHAEVSNGREQAMAKFGADVRRIDGNYDDSVKVVAQEAERNNWIIISDNSYPGYLDIPKFVTAGYTVMLGEVVEQLSGHIPSHIFIQGGCGGLASAVCGYFWELWGEKRPRLIVVEPANANCLQLSALHGKMMVVDGALETLMAGLSCGEVSQIAWEILATGADDFITLPERFVPLAMQAMANGIEGDPRIEAGESAVAGVGALLALADDNEARGVLNFGEESSVLVFGTEGATDPELYEQLINA